MTFLWVLLAALVALLGVRYRSSLYSLGQGEGVPEVDDAAVESILQTGRISDSDSETLDMETAARAEEEFWTEYWDEPEEYRP